VRIGLIGTGTISGIYLTNARDRFADLEVVAVADLVRERAEEKAREFGIPAVLSVDELIAHPEIDTVLNLTIPAAHYDIAKRAILAGKHAFAEKPLAVDPADGRELVTLAAEHGVRIGAAPDTFLGAACSTRARSARSSALPPASPATATSTGTRIPPSPTSTGEDPSSTSVRITSPRSLP
jgi:predicted dehydrogenase